VRPVGGTKVRHVDVRLVTASNRDLEAEVEAGRFRADLFYRLNIFPIEVPPLRERREDIEMLANHFLTLVAATMNRAAPRLSESAKQILMAYHWPGNVRARPSWGRPSP
jgi:transcriptional regulator with GAF, ATPase, and Fis domain